MKLAIRVKTVIIINVKKFKKGDTMTKKQAMIEFQGGGGSKNKLLRGNTKGFTFALKNILPAFLQKKLAFTLAEVLITLGIIGIVAAMTLPT